MHHICVYCVCYRWGETKDEWRFAKLPHGKNKQGNMGLWDKKRTFSQVTVRKVLIKWKTGMAGWNPSRGSTKKKI